MGTKQVPLQVGKIVLLESLNVARYNWPLARVLEVYPDQKGIVRTARVLCRGEEYKRPVSKLVRLELDSEDAANQAPSDDDDEVEIGSADSTPVDSDEERYDDVRQEVPAGTPPANDVINNVQPDEDEVAAIPREPGRAARPVRRAAARQRQRLAHLIESDQV